MLGEAQTPPEIFEMLADGLGFDSVRPSEEQTGAAQMSRRLMSGQQMPAGQMSAEQAPEEQAPEELVPGERISGQRIRAAQLPEGPMQRTQMPADRIQAMKAAGVPADIIVAFASKPLSIEQLIYLAQANTSPEIFSRLSQKLGFETVATTEEQVKSLKQAEVPQEIVDGFQKALADKELQGYETAHNAWEEHVAPYRRLYEALVGAAKSGDKLTMLLPDLRQLSATYSDTPETYRVGGTKDGGGDSFVGSKWRISISEPGFHLFSSAGDVDISFAVRTDGSGNASLYRIEDRGRVDETPVHGDVRSFVAALGIDVPLEPSRPSP